MKRGVAVWDEEKQMREQRKPVNERHQGGNHHGEKLVHQQPPQGDANATLASYLLSPTGICFRAYREHTSTGLRSSACS